MGETMHGSAARVDLVVVSIDHHFIQPEHAALAQHVYDAMAVLDIAAPSAILPLDTYDLRLLVDVGDAWSAAVVFPLATRHSLERATRRIGHMLERRSTAIRSEGRVEHDAKMRSSVDRAEGAAVSARSARWDGAQPRPPVSPT